MKGSTHVVIGLSFGVTTQLLVGFPAEGFLEIPFYYGGLVLGSLLPDIDHPQSYLGRRLTPLSVPIFKLFGHRGITHSFLSLSILGIILTESLIHEKESIKNGKQFYKKVEVRGFIVYLVHRWQTLMYFRNKLKEMWTLGLDLNLRTYNILK